MYVCDFSKTKDRKKDATLVLYYINLKVSCLRSSVLRTRHLRIRLLRTRYVRIRLLRTRYLRITLARCSERTNVERLFVSKDQRFEPMLVRYSIPSLVSTCGGSRVWGRVEAWIISAHAR